MAGNGGGGVEQRKVSEMGGPMGKPTNSTPKLTTGWEPGRIPSGTRLGAMRYPFRSTDCKGTGQAGLGSISVPARTVRGRGANPQAPGTGDYGRAPKTQTRPVGLPREGS